MCTCIGATLSEKKRSRVLFAVKPLTVIIRRPGRKAIGNESLLAGKRYDMECETTGSRPPAVITWYKGRRRQLKHTTVRWREVTAAAGISASHK